ncbi:MAG: hypothetical protein ACREQW_22065 [Candidatus Binatia bacterium]
MGRVSRSVEKAGDQTTIFAYGFDAAGFDIQDEAKELADGSKAEFLRFYDSRDLNKADGVIIPQGIFEKIATRKKPFWGAATEVSVHKWPLLERERQIFDLLRKGKWVCFLVGKITDEISQGIDSQSIDDTDLCKRLLNAFNISRHHRYNLAIPARRRTRDSEFESYVRDYGRPTTVLELPHVQPIERRVLVELTNNAVVGIEFEDQVFFLPFSPPDKKWPTAVSVVKSVALAISQYRRQRIIEIPSWVDEMRFRSEEALYLQINSLLEKVNRLESQLESWRDYKAILTTSGIPLRSRIVAILESFFELKVDWIEGHHEEAIIKGDDGSPLVIFESRSTNGDIENAWIDQLSSNRRNQGLPQSIPGVLLINTDRSLRLVERRLEKTIPEDQVQYAKMLNVLLVRTIDLLFLMQQLENDVRRKERLMELFSSGGGWLKADKESYRVVS